MEGVPGFPRSKMTKQYWDQSMCPTMGGLPISLHQAIVICSRGLIVDQVSTPEPSISQSSPHELVLFVAGDLGHNLAFGGESQKFSGCIHFLRSFFAVTDEHQAWANSHGCGRGANIVSAYLKQTISGSGSNKDFSGSLRGEIDVRLKYIPAIVAIP